MKKMLAGLAFVCGLFVSALQAGNLINNSGIVVFLSFVGADDIEVAPRGGVSEECLRKCLATSILNSNVCTGSSTGDVGEGDLTCMRLEVEEDVEGDTDLRFRTLRSYSQAEVRAICDGLATQDFYLFQG